MGDELKPVTRAEMEREIEHLKEVIDTLLTERARALELQGLEYHRRLTELNNAHERAERAAQLTVPRDLFDASHSENMKWREGVNSEIATLRGAAAGSARLFYIVTVLLGLAFTAITLLLRLK